MTLSQHPDEERDVTIRAQMRALASGPKSVDKIIYDLIAERDALRQQLTEAQADRERLNWLEDQVIASAGREFWIIDPAERGLWKIDPWGGMDTRDLIDAARLAGTIAPGGASAIAVYASRRSTAAARLASSSESGTPERKGRKSDHPCDRCKQFEVYVSQDREDGADYDIHCYGCGHHYRVDGPDA